MKEIITYFINTKYFCSYIYLIELYNLLNIEEQYYIQIFCSLIILGIKKGTPINAIVIDTLKDFTQNDFIEKSKFYSQIKSIKYENVNESFIKNFLLLYELIKLNEDEEKINRQIAILKNQDEQSSVSNNSENISLIKEEKESMDEEIQKKEEIYSQKYDKINRNFIKEDKVNNKNPEINIKNENINKIQNEDDKKELDKKESENEKNDIQNNKIEKSISDFSLEELLNFIKVKSKEFKYDIKVQDKDKDNYINLSQFLQIIQTHNKYFYIIRQLDKLKKPLKK